MFFIRELYNKVIRKSNQLCFIIRNKSVVPKGKETVPKGKERMMNINYGALMGRSKMRAVWTGFLATYLGAP